MEIQHSEIEDSGLEGDQDKPFGSEQDVVNNTRQRVAEWRTGLRRGPIPPLCHLPVISHSLFDRAYVLDD